MFDIFYFGFCFFCWGFWFFLKSAGKVEHRKGNPADRPTEKFVDFTKIWAKTSQHKVKKTKKTLFGTKQLYIFEIKAKKKYFAGRF